jgi:hypothetical protein
MAHPFQDEEDTYMYDDATLLSKQPPGTKAQQEMLHDDDLSNPLPEEGMYMQLNAATRDEMKEEFTNLVPVYMPLNTATMDEMKEEFTNLLPVYMPLNTATMDEMKEEFTTVHMPLDAATSDEMREELSSDTALIVDAEVNKLLLNYNLTPSWDCPTHQYFQYLCRIKISFTAL